MLRGDLVNWIAVYLITLVGFSMAIFVVMTTEYPDADTNIIPGDFGSISATIFTCFRYTFGGVSYTPWRDLPENKSWANFLFVAFSICTQCVLLNLFIAMLNHTFEANFRKADEARRRLGFLRSSGPAAADRCCSAEAGPPQSLPFIVSLHRPSGGPTTRALTLKHGNVAPPACRKAF